MDLSIAKSIFETLYQDVQGYNLSFEARKKFEFYDRGLTYGEIVPDSFYEMLKEADPKKGEVFYDLGSGSGKAVIAAALFFPFSKAIGIELLEDLYNGSQYVLERFKKEIQPHLTQEIIPTIQFFHQDFLDFDFSDGDIVFAHATCFHDGQIRRLFHKFDTLKKGARLLLVSKSISLSSFKLVKSGEYPLSWGKATLHLYEKIV